MKRKLLLVLFSICLIQVSAQHNIKSMRYNVKSLGMNVGEFTVTQYINNEGLITTESVNEIRVKVLLPYKIKYTLYTTHKDGRLLQSHLQTKKNNKLDSDTWLIADANDYICVKDNDTVYINEPITYTGSLMYFNEPVDIEHVYKEKSGEKRFIKSIGDHMYALVNNKGDVTHEYTYTDGILTNAKIKHSIADIYLEYCN